MKLLRSRFLALLLLGVSLPALGLGATGSIPVSKSTPVSELPRLAKVSIVTAINAALAVAKGTVIEAKLFVHGGSLQFNIIVVGADQALFNVDVDAGNGKVLLLEKDGGEIDLDTAALAPKK